MPAAPAKVFTKDQELKATKEAGVAVPVPVSTTAAAAPAATATSADTPSPAPTPAPTPATGEGVEKVEEAKEGEEGADPEPTTAAQVPTTVAVAGDGVKEASLSAAAAAPPAVPPPAAPAASGGQPSPSPATDNAASDAASNATVTAAGTTTGTAQGGAPGSPQRSGSPARVLEHQPTAERLSLTDPDQLLDELVKVSESHAWECASCIQQSRRHMHIVFTMHSTLPPPTQYHMNQAHPTPHRLTPPRPTPPHPTYPTPQMRVELNGGGLTSLVPEQDGELKREGYAPPGSWFKPEVRTGHRC